MNEYLKRFLAEREAMLKELQKRSDESEDLAEVRRIGEEMKQIRKDITEAQAQLREEPPKDAQLHNAVVVNRSGAVNDEDIEYRKAFMRHVLTGTPIEKRADENTLTTDVPAVIPTILLNRIIQQIDDIGMILPLVTRTFYQGGLVIPKLGIKPVASWVAEGATSDKQKYTTAGSVTFSHFKLRCEVSMSAEVDAMSLSAFEALFTRCVADAMVKAIEDAIINGDGSGKPTGILTLTPPTGQTITGALNGTTGYTKLCEAEGALPSAYDNVARWCMNKKTFAKILGMVDSVGQPVARVDYGLVRGGERTILGRSVVISPYIPDDKAFIYDFNDYVLNTIYDLGIERRRAWDTEDIQTKAVMSVDGKPIDNQSLVLFNITVAG